MKFQQCALAFLAVPALAVSGFVAPQASASRVPTSVAATVEKELTPPRSLEEVTKDLAATQELYKNVQTTYG